MSVTWLKRGLSVATAVFAVLAMTVPAAAQGGSVHVSVVDRTNAQPVNGARVVLEGTRFTGTTDGRGELTLSNVPPGTYSVRVLAIGYRSSTQSVTVTLGGTANLNYELGLSAVSLDEIVVTGTGGAVEKRKLGTSLGTVDVSRVQDIVDVTNIGSVLRARIPGVRSVAPSGGVGSSQDLRVRGVSSFSLGQRPIVYIDGVRLDTRSGNWGGGGTTCCGFNGYSGNDRLGDLNPDDIERIEVIKGAAAATLYGTEATNGVIQIFTKQGRSNSAPRWSLSYGAGFNRLRDNIPTKEHPRFTGPDGTVAQDAADLIQNGLIQRGDITVQGGGEAVTYFLSTGISYEEGSIQPNDQMRGNVRLNLNWSASDNWSFELQSAFAKNRAQLLQSGNNWTSLFGNAVLGNPVTATVDEPFGEPWTAVQDIIEIQSESFVNRWTGGATVNFNPTEAFGHRLTMGLDQVTDRRERLHPWGRSYQYVGTDAERSVAYRNFSSWTMDYLGTLGFDISSAIQSDFSFGAQGFWETDRNNVAIGEGYAGEGVWTVSGGAVRSGREGFREEINVGLFAQNRFSIADKLFVTAGARLDGNSAFGDNFGLQFYPKAELAYVISEEGFLPSAISSLKLRGAVGRSGLAPGAFDQFRTFTPSSVMEGENGVNPDNPGNPDLEPEKTTEFEAGLDIGLFDDRVSIEATGYYSKTTEALLDVDLPPSSGFNDEQVQNIGAIENKGWEVKLDWAAIEGDNFRWSMGVLMDGNTNQILDLGPFADCNDEGTHCRLGNSRMGYAVGALWGREMTGFDAATIRHERSDTSVYQGDPLPSWSGSLTQSVEFGAFRVYALASWEKGAVFNNSDRPYRVRQRASDELLMWVADDGTYSFEADSVLDYHTRLGAYDKRDHIRIQEVSLTYQVPNMLSSKLGLSRTTLTVSGQNLYWWDDCNCMNPTMSYSTWDDDVIGSSGFLAQPQPRTFMFTLRTTF
jgi:TonB-dependent SusC/RagA subfamily outer membrane receptor